MEQLKYQIDFYQLQINQEINNITKEFIQNLNLQLSLKYQLKSIALVRKTLNNFTFIGHKKKNNITKMIFFSQKIKFKKQSESVGLNLKDKQIKKNKQQLLQLTKKHNQVDQTLNKYKTDFQQQTNKLLSQHQLLLQEQKKRKLKILKLSIRKDQLLSRSNPLIKQQKAQILKKYLKSVIYTIGDRYDIISYLGNTSTYEFIKTKVLHLEHKMYLKSKMKEIVFMKKVKFQNQFLMLVIKEMVSAETIKSIKETQFSHHKTKTIKSITNPSKFNPSTQNLLKGNKSYEVRIYAITGKHFDYIKVYNQNQLIYFIDWLLNKNKSLHPNNRISRTSHLQRNKPRLSLEFNPVFKKSLEGFFFKRSSLTASQIQSKLIDVEQLLNEGKNCQRSGRESERSVNQLLQTSQDHTQMNSTVMSKTSHAQSHDYSSIQTSTKNQQLKTQSNFQKENNFFSPSQKTNLETQQNQGANKFAQKQSILNQEDQTLNNNLSVKQLKEPFYTGFIRSFLYGQKVLFPITNPLMNIVILKDKNKFQFLPEYLQKKQNFQLILLCVKKYQLKIKLQKQVRRSLLYKIIKIQSFFQSQNKQIEPFSLDVLFTVKYAKNDIYIPKIVELKQSLKLGREFKLHQKLKGKHKNGFEGVSKDFRTFNVEDIVVTCQNIKCEIQERTFLINHLLKEQVFSDLNNKVFNLINNTGTINNRTKGRGQNLQVKRKQAQSKSKEDKQKDERRKLRKKKTSRQKVQNNQLSKQQQKRKDLLFREEVQGMFESFLQNHLLSIKEYRFMKKIDYPAFLDKIIIIQKNLKCFYYRKIYKKTKRFPSIFKFQSTTKILISAILDQNSHQVKIFTECLVLRLNKKYTSYPLIFSDKYWITIGAALSNLLKLSDSVVEVKDELQKYIQRKIKNYQEQQAKIQALKPELYLNRLRRFFINIMLRVKVKRNILFLKKIYTNSETYVLIIRRSVLLNNVCHANLYHLQDAYQRQQIVQKNHDILELQQSFVPPEQKIIKTSNNIQKRNKIKYQTINLFVDYFSSIPKQKITEQFYFDDQHFLLKPPQEKSIFYIERLLIIDINSEEIAKEVAMIQWQDPTKKRKNLENGSFINLEDMQESKLLHSFNSKSQMINSKLGLKTQQSRLKLKRKNASIMIDEELERKLMIPNDKVRKNRASFRISERNKCVLLKDQQGKSSNNEMKHLVVNKQGQSLTKHESKQKLSTNNKLSRSSLYDIFNNSMNKKAQYEIKGNGHGKFIYYSLVKVEQFFFQLRIYIVKRTFLIVNKDKQFKTNKNEEKNENVNVKGRNIHHKLLLKEKVNYQCKQQSQVEQQYELMRKNAFSDELFLIHKQNINKKQLLQATWNFFYHRIAQWLKKNQHLLLIPQKTNNKI